MRLPQVGVITGVAAALASTGCTCDSRRTDDSPLGQTGAALLADPPATSQPGKPGPLAVAVVFDQLGSDTLQRLWPLLDEAGAFKTAARRGAYFKRAAYPYLNTLTAPGHAAIFTGAPPHRSGIAGNEEWREDRGVVVPTVDSPGIEVFGRSEVTAGTSRLRAQTVAESLVQTTGGKAKVVSLSLKDRGALLPVGKGANACLWFDSTLGAFTSSTQCGKALPPWLSEHQRKHPIKALIQPWLPLDAERYAELLGPDDAPGEGGWGRTFPHDPSKVPSPSSTLRMHPALSEYLVGLGETATVAERMGRDDVADLLVISFSGTDYVGHNFGPHSWEYADHLIRADRKLGAWLSELAERSRLSVMITSDHGVAPLPERSTAEGKSAGRLFASELQAHLEQALDAQVAALDGGWVAAVIGSFIHFSRAAKEREGFADVLKVAKRALEGVDGVASVDVLHGAPLPDDAQLLASLPPTGAPELFLHPKPYWVFGYGVPPGSGTNHGSGQSYDQQVPLLFYGEGVGHLVEDDPVDQLRAAPTLASLLGTQLSDPATLPALPLRP